MTKKNQGREYDFVLFGATGFTGGLTADYLAVHAPAGARWALVGRNQAKLEVVRDRLTGIDARCANLPLLQADANDPASLSAIAESTRVAITTVGPYLEFGEPLVAACAAAGTDYVDLAGEPEFIDRMYLAYHHIATGTGARLVHACGFDSIPHDLGALYTAQQLPAAVPVSIHAVVRTNATFSGGTLHSAFGQLSRLRSMQQAATARKRAEVWPADRRAQVKTGFPRRDRATGAWLIPLPTIDPQIVKRSALARGDYGPNFTYSHYAGAKRVSTVLAAAVGLPAVVLALQAPPVRRALGRRVPPGTGPSQERRRRTWFTVDFIREGGGQVVHTQIRGGDPAYTDTAMMLAESALCLAYDDNPTTAGQVTTATAMGDHLIKRLVDAGISFTVKSGNPQTSDAERT